MISVLAASERYSGVYFELMRCIVLPVLFSSGKCISDYLKLYRDRDQDAVNVMASLLAISKRIKIDSFVIYVNLFDTFKTVYYPVS